MTLGFLNSTFLVYIFSLCISRHLFRRDFPSVVNFVFHTSFGFSLLLVLFVSVYLSDLID
ncbi:hypothetical protein BGX38DRAFT_1194140 [Terfezia claveryi]|nr:hypothetical protein BGX38DRAFT_1194140 [Terfezia claveryi]